MTAKEIYTKWQGIWMGLAQYKDDFLDDVAELSAEAVCAKYTGLWPGHMQLYRDDFKADLDKLTE